MFLGLTPRLPVSVSTTLLFLANLHENNYAATSIVSILSAVSYFHKANNFPDPTSAFLVIKAIAGARNLSRSVDIRLPITPCILSKLVDATVHVFSSPYKALLIRTMMVLAFKAYLRVGEMVPRCLSSGLGCLQLGDVFSTDSTLTVCFRKFKHSSKHGPQTLTLKNATVDGTCINLNVMLCSFIQFRGPKPGTLFSFPDGTPMVRHEFDLALQSLLAFCGLDSKQFKGHSFRIGAATAAAVRGDSDAQIRAAGRWSSDAFRRYIRIA